MKKNILLLLVGVFAMTFLSCDDFLDRKPKSNLSPENYFKDKVDMENWNAGIYLVAATSLDRRHVDWGEIRSDAADLVPGRTQANMYMNALKSDMGEYSWQGLYQCIGRCNIAIESYPAIPSVLESEYAPYLAQAYSMRALMYFYIIRIWGRAPLVTSVWDGDLHNSQVSRSSIEDVKAQILSDLDEAIRLFGSDVSSRFYMTLAGAMSLKTDVHLWFKEYDKAVEASEYFVNNSAFAYVNSEEEYKNIFLSPENSSEAIFNLWWSYDKNGKGHTWAVVLGASNTNNNWRMSYKVYETFISRLRRKSEQFDLGHDCRLWVNVDTVQLYYENSRIPISYADYYADKRYATQKNVKFSQVDANREYDAVNKVYKSLYKVLDSTDATIYTPIYRYADVMLLRAEALNKMGRGAEAAAIVNAIRKRVGYNVEVPPIRYDDVNEMENLILEERLLEFVGEGKRWFDLKRTDKLIEIMEPIYQQRQQTAGSTVTEFDIDRYYGPIHYREFEANAALRGDQNKPYTE